VKPAADVASTHCDPKTGAATGFSGNGDMGFFPREHADTRKNALNISAAITAGFFFIFNASLFLFNFRRFLQPRLFRQQIKNKVPKK